MAEPLGGSVRAPSPPGQIGERCAREAGGGSLLLLTCWRHVCHGAEETMLEMKEGAGFAKRHSAQGSCLQVSFNADDSLGVRADTRMMDQEKGRPHSGFTWCWHWP